MRIASLALERFGPFENRTLQFDLEKRLHVVYGPNEAGKTTALVAIEALLYGIDARTPHAFRFRNEELRIGAELVARDGTRRVVRRRKGNRATLLDANDAPVPDDVLAPFLSGVSRETFRDAFGLSQSHLRAGAAAMLEAQGEVGRSLFAAASGLGDLARVADALDEEAKALFRERGREQPFAQALDRYNTARTAVRDASLPWKTWQALTGEAQALAGRIAACVATQRALASERSRLERVRRTAPILAKLDDAQREADRHADMPEAADDLPDRIEAALRQRADAERDRADLARRIAALDERLGAALDAACLAESAAIAALVEGRKAFRDAEADIVKREGEAREARAALAERARRLGFADETAMLARVPTPADLARLRRLLEEGGKLDTETALIDADRRKAAEALERAERAKMRLPPATDPDGLAARFAALEPLRDAVKTRADLAAEVERRRGRLAEAALRLMPPVPDLDALATRPLPARESVAGHAEAVRALRTRADDIARRRREADEAVREAEAALAEFARGDVVTPERLADARRRRDALWADARGFVTGERSDGAADPAARRALALDLDRAIPAADALADARTREADRVAQHAELERRRDAALRARAARDEDARAVAGETAALAERWAALWAATGLAPADPLAMPTWLEKVQALLTERDEVAAVAARVAAIDLRAAEAADVMAALASELRLAPAPASSPLLRLGEIEAAIGHAVTAWQTRRDAVRAIAEATDARDAAVRRAGETATRMTDWLGRWKAATGLVGATEDAGLDEVRARIEDWASVQVEAPKLETAMRRLSAMRDDTAAYRSGAADLAARLAPDIAARQALDIVDALRERLETAKAAAATRARDAEERGQLAEQLAESGAAQAQADAALEALVAGDAAPAAFAERLRARARARAAVRARRDELLEAGDGLAEAALRADVAAEPIDAVLARLAQLPDETERATETLRLLERDHARVAADMAAADARQTAEAAAQDQASAAAELEDIARRWAVLVAARTLAREALARHRARYQDPLVARASMLFAKLTGGGFVGLGVSYDEDGAGRLAGRRPDGTAVRVEGLSEGTRDQLYLALRLASLDAFAAEADPLPFVGDDLLVSFDDDRLLHALDVLTETGRQTQVLLFTHHRHVAQAAAGLNGVEIVAI